ncbi:uroporphyrinogen-III synthase [Methylobacterium iners]|uniref:uroporphyrinogen-III synthase n=1 Tax=Methylobacterium iners TaxID=418707 RepID=UPI00360B526D
MRIWVARPEPGATRTAERLAALGHDPLLAPVLAVTRAIGPPPEGDFAGLLLTSANAVPALAAQAIAGVPVFAVGTRTAAAARAAGACPVLDAEGDAAALSRLVRATLAPGATLLHLAGAERKREPAASLEAAGYRIRIFTAYAAEPVPALPSRVAEALGGTAGRPRLDGALHYSRRSAEAALELAGAAGLGGAFAALKHYCLSADVAVPLVAAAIEVHFVPTRPSEEALLAGLVA